MVQVHDNNKFGKVCIILGFVVGERGSYLGGLGEEWKGADLGLHLRGMVLGTFLLKL